MCFRTRIVPERAASAWTARSHGTVDSRARRGAPRSIGASLTAVFTSRSSARSVRALTLEDGTLVVTDNYLKVRIPPGLRA